MKKAKLQKRLLLFRYFLTIFFIVSAVVIGAVIGFYYNEKGDYLARLKLEERVNVRLEKELIQANLGEIVSDLRFLSEQNELIRMLNQGTSMSKSRDLIAKEYRALSLHKQKYDQIRFIDTDGKEVVRVNFNNGNVVIVPNEQLQEKGDRYYFKDTLALLHGEIFISPFDLNMERGEIEKPLKPMIRLGTPVFDGENRKRGVLVLNYLGNRLLKTVEEGSKISSGDFMLVNSDGYWLSGPDAGDEWGFMFAGKEDRKFSSDFPDAWKKILPSPETQIENEKGLFTSATVYPVKEDFRTSTGSAHVRGDSHKRLMGSDYFWKVISFVPGKTLEEGVGGLQTGLLLLVIALLLVMGVASWIIARDMVKRKSYQMALYRSANYDKLTDLPNRALFLDRLDQNLKQARRYDRRFALLFVDLDGFKSVNDTLGHDAGDALLAETAKRLLGCVREADTVARIGGDEFTVILGTLKAVDDAKTVSEKIIGALSTPFVIKDQEVKIGASIGISVFPESGNDTDTLLKKADGAMYQAKKNGKNGYRLSEG